MKIAVDAMGGDHAPQAVVQGALQALEAYPDLEIILVGDEQQIRKHLSDNHQQITIVHTTEHIAPDEEPVKAVRQKKDASLVLVTKMVKEGVADACISAGNTGAYMTAGLLVTGRMKGIERPALVAFMPTRKGTPTLVLDVGANVDAKPEHLVQYALMGNIYAQDVLKINQPKIGLLNVGTEDSKGNDLMKKTFPLLQQSGLHFVGNVEARDVTAGIVDVLVCDGFSGNVLLKTAEGVAGLIFSTLKEEFMRTPFTKLVALLMKSGLKRNKAKLDYTEYGGSPLLGLNGLCIKAHGSSDAKSIKNTIFQARSFIQADLQSLIQKHVAEESVGKASD